MRNFNDFNSNDSDARVGGDPRGFGGGFPHDRGEGFGAHRSHGPARGGFRGLGRGFDRMGGGGRRDRGFEGGPEHFGRDPRGEHMPDDGRFGGAGFPDDGRFQGGPDADPRGGRPERRGGGRGRRPGFGGPGGMGDFGPGFGPGFGGPMGGPRSGRGGRGPGRGRKGDVRNAILALLKDQPMNGYQLITAIGEKSEGLWNPSAGSVYPALGLLSDEGLIHETQVDGRKASELTEAGREYVEQHADELTAPWEKVAGPHQGFLDIRPEVGQLSMAVQQVVMQGDQAQIEAVRGILDRARKDIYRLLAGDAASTPDGAADAQ